MAVVASGGSVAIAAYTLVSVIRAGLRVRTTLRMAVDAGKACIIRGDLVAVAADGAMMRNWEVRVVKGSAGPRRSGVATVAGGRIAGRNMVGDAAAQSLCAVPLCGVATIAGGVRGGEAVVVVHVAKRTCCGGVLSGKCPSGR